MGKVLIRSKEAKVLAVEAIDGGDEFDRVTLYVTWNDFCEDKIVLEIPVSTFQSRQKVVVEVRLED